MNKFSEKEFGCVVVDLLRNNGFETWQEVVTSGGIIDIVAKHSGAYFAFELKRQISDKLLEQAENNQRFVNYSSIIVPYNILDWNTLTLSDVKHFYAAQKGIGVIKFDHLNHAYEPYTYGRVLINSVEIASSVISVRLHPKLVAHEGRVIPIEQYLMPESKESQAGSTAGGAMTGFKKSCMLLQKYYSDHKGCTKKQMWDDLRNELHWGSYASMCQSLKKFYYLDIVRKIWDGE